MSNKTDCTFVMDKFLELDKNEKFPLWMTKHFLTCEKCRANVRMFTQAERMLRKDAVTQNPFSYATISEVKEKLYPGSTKPKKVPLFYWLVIGIILLICMIFFEVYINRFIPELQAYSFIFVAGIITTYTMLFIGFNLDLFVKH